MRACECVCGVCVCMCLSVCLCGMPAECVRTCVWCVRMVCRLSKHVRACVCVDEMNMANDPISPNVCLEREERREIDRLVEMPVAK